MEERIEEAAEGAPEPGDGQVGGDEPGADAGRTDATAKSTAPPPDTGDGSGAAERGPIEIGPELAAFSRRIAVARGRTPDFDAVALNPDLPVTTAMAATIACAERGPEIAYHLGCNPELAERIAGLDPLSAARELGRIEAQLTAAPKRTVTGAPPPLRSLGASETPHRDPDAMSYREYKAWRRTG